MTAVTKLESGPKKLSITSILKSGDRTKFLRTAGISYNALMTKKLKGDKNLDVSTFNIESWVLGQSRFAPTWGNLLKVLRNIHFEKSAVTDSDVESDVNFDEIAKAIESYLREVEQQYTKSDGPSQLWSKRKHKHKLKGKP